MDRKRPRNLCSAGLCLGLSLLAAPLSGCAPGAQLPVAKVERSSAYRLGVDDRIRIITYGEDQLSKEFRVSDGGDVALPLVGAVHAEGLTTTELGDKVSALLRERRLLRNPSVSVEVISYRPIFVLGEVTKPGEYPFQPGMTMLQAVSVAGGFTYRAIERYAYVVRQASPEPQEARLLPHSFLRPGDVVKIYERNF